MAGDGDLRPTFRQRLHTGIVWTSVETGGSQLGVADSNFLMDGGAEGWIEFKRITGLVVTLRPEQIGWCVRRAMLGGRVLVATRRVVTNNSRHGDCDQLWIHDGLWARELRTQGVLAVPPLSVSEGGPGQWKWDEVRRVMELPVAAYRAGR